MRLMCQCGRLRTGIPNRPMPEHLCPFPGPRQRGIISNRLFFIAGKCENSYRFPLPVVARDVHGRQPIASRNAGRGAQIPTVRTTVTMADSGSRLSLCSAIHPPPSFGWTTCASDARTVTSRRAEYRPARSGGLERGDATAQRSAGANIRSFDDADGHLPDAQSS